MTDEQVRTADPETLLKCYGKLLRRIAGRYQKMLSLTGAYDMDDLIQVGSLALLQAQRNYDPAAGMSFKNYAWQWIQTAMRRELGIENGTLPVLPESLDEPLTNDAEDTQLDLIADESIEPNDERLERLERYAELHRAIDRLESDKHREIIQRVYFDEQSIVDAAADLDMKPDEVSRAKTQALVKLRRDRRLKQLCEPMFSTSLSAFRLSFTSSVEAAMLWKEKQIDKLLGEGTYARLPD